MYIYVLDASIMVNMQSSKRFEAWWTAAMGWVLQAHASDSVNLFPLQTSASSIEERIDMVELDVSSDTSVEKASDQLSFKDVRKWVNKQWSA